MKMCAGDEEGSGWIEERNCRMHEIVRRGFAL